MWEKTHQGELVRSSGDICRTRCDIFVGAAIALGVDDLKFVNSSTKFLEIEKRRTGDALFIKITGQEARP